MWDGDGLPDLVLPTETNRIFWYGNIGTRSAPKFGPRHQILCDGFSDSTRNGPLRHSRPKSRQRNTPRASAICGERSTVLLAPGGGIANFNGDGLIDMVTHGQKTGTGPVYRFFGLPRERIVA